MFGQQAEKAATSAMSSYLRESERPAARGDVNEGVVLLREGVVQLLFIV